MEKQDKKTIDIKCSTISLEEKERYCSIVESLPDLICSCDVDGKPTYVNQAYCDFTSKTKLDLMKSNIFDLISQDALPDVLKLLKTITPENPIIQYVALPEKDKVNQWISWNIRGVFDPKGKVVEYHAIGRDVTDQKNTEESLKESQQDYYDIVERSPDMIHSIDKDGHILFVNKRECELLGYSKDELVGKHIYDIYPPEEHERVGKGFETLQKEGKLYVTGAKMLKKDGDVVEVEIDSVAVSDQQGNFIRTRSIIRDVTTKKKQKMAAAASEQKYKMVVENANEVILVAQDNKIKFANPKIEEVTGYSRDDLYSKRFTDFIHPDDQKMVADRYAKRLAGESVKANYTFRIVTKAKDTRWLEIHSVQIEWEEKPAVLSFLTDVTEREKASHGLKRSEELYRSMFDQAIDSITLVRLDGTFSHMNQGFKKKFGYTDEEYKKIRITDLEVSDSSEEISQHINLIKEKGSDTFETRLKNKAGDILDFLISVKLVKLDDEQFLHSVIRDITDKKKAEDELNQKIEQMEFMGRLNIKRHKKMLEMQTEIIALKKRLGETPPLLEELDEFNSDES